MEHTKFGSMSLHSLVSCLQVGHEKGRTFLILMGLLKGNSFSLMCSDLHWMKHMVQQWEVHLQPKSMSGCSDSRQMKHTGWGFLRFKETCDVLALDIVGNCVFAAGAQSGLVPATEHFATLRVCFASAE
jgi:hypothetical protein